MTPHTFEGRRVLITGAARGIGAALAERLAGKGAWVALPGLEPRLLSELSSRLGSAPWRECDVADRVQVEKAVEELVGELGSLDIVVANARIGAQMTLVGGRPDVMERTLAVNTLGAYYTVAAARTHVSHPGGYVLLTSSAAAGFHLPLMGAYCASKAAVEAIGDCLRVELLPTGARVGVAYFAEIDTDMTSRGMKTEAASRLGAGGPFTSVSPLAVAVDALERGISRRARRIYARDGWASYSGSGWAPSARSSDGSPALFPTRSTWQNETWSTSRRHSPHGDELPPRGRGAARHHCPRLCLGRGPCQRDEPAEPFSEARTTQAALLGLDPLRFCSHATRTATEASHRNSHSQRRFSERLRVRARAPPEARCALGTRRSRDHRCRAWSRHPVVLAARTGRDSSGGPASREV